MVAAIVTVSGGQPSSAFVEAVHRRTAGLPFVVEELMRVVGPRAPVSELLEAELPWSLEEAVRQQLEGLDHGQRRVVEALAVYGRAASFESLMVVTEAEEADLLTALRALTSAAVVVEVSDDQFWFSHALVADAVVHQLLGRERRRLHERCFEAVRRTPMLDHAALAYHARGAGRHDEVPAIARRGAASYLDKGLTFAALRLAAEGLAEAPSDPELLAVATEAAWRLDFLDEALATALRWVKIAVEPEERIDAAALRLPALPRAQRRVRGPCPSGRPRIVVVCTRRPSPARQGGMVAGAAAHDRRSLGRGDHTGPSGRWSTPAPWATTSPKREHSSSVPERASSTGRWRESLAMFHEALDAARRSGDAVLLTRAINNGLELLPSHLPEAAALRAEMQEISSRIGFDKLGTSATLAWETGGRLRRRRPSTLASCGRRRLPVVGAARPATRVELQRPRRVRSRGRAARGRRPRLRGLHVAAAHRASSTGTSASTSPWPPVAATETPASVCSRACWHSRRRSTPPTRSTWRS